MSGEEAVKPVSLYRRLGCCLLDVTLAECAVRLFVSVDRIFHKGRYFGSEIFGSTYINMAVVGLLFLFVTVTLAKFGQTPGKMCGYLKVVKLDGSGITFFQAAVRAFFCFGVVILPYWAFVTAKEPLNFVLAIPYGYFAVNCLFAISDKERRRALHDMVAGTKVISLVKNA